MPLNKETKPKIYTQQLNDQIVLLLTIQLSMCHLFALILNLQQSYLTHREEPIRCYHSGPQRTWEQWQ